MSKYKFSSSSSIKLQTCHRDLQRIFNEVIKFQDCTITEGLRTRERQEKLVKEGKSKTMNSMHLANHEGVSMAVDVVPYFKNKPHIRWEDEKSFYHFGGFVIAISKMLKASGQITHSVRWGGNWDMDDEFKDQSFFDLPHFELIP